MSEEEFQRKKKKKAYSAPSVNVDYALIEQVNQITATKTPDIKLLSPFIESGSLAKLLSIWSYYSSTNDLNHLIDTSSKLSQITRQINELRDELLHAKQIIIDTYKDILNKHEKIIYRALNNMKPALTNTNIRILNNIISFDYVIVQEFLNSFDLTLSVLPKLLEPKKFELENKEVNDELSIRSNFLRFWFNLCSSVNYIARQDLLIGNFKIVKNIWKFLNYDSIESVKNTLAFIDTKILQEPNYRRSLKCKILNEGFMFKVSGLFGKFSDDNKGLIEFLDKLATDSKYGLVFPNDKLWQKDSDLGVAIDINNKHFKMANKLLYTLVTSLKPHESNSQLQFVVRVLGGCQELIAPYMNWLVQHGGGYHDPALTSWWIAYTLLYSNVLQLELPKFTTNTDYLKFDAKLISENLVFAPLSKSALTNGLVATKKPLITQLTLQIILYILKKLESILDIVRFDVRQELIDLVFNQLPDLTSISQAFLNNESSKLIKLTALTIVSKYENLLPSLNTSSVQKIVSSGISSILNNANVTAYQLTLLDLYMLIQKNQDFKWWNKLNNSSNSFFTSLIKLCAQSNINKSFTLKIYQLLNKLCMDKMVFNDGLLVTPIMALIYSLDVQVDDRIWNMLDETISRIVRTPYKYLDLSHKQYDDTSIFVVALLEQFKFTLGKGESDAGNITWLFKFIQYLVLIGEPKSALLELAKPLEIDTTELTKMLQFDTTSPIESKDASIMDVVLNYSTDDLIKQSGVLEKKVISSNLDFLAGLLLINCIIDQDKPAGKLLETVYSKFWSFLMNSSAEAIRYFMSEKTWSQLFNNDSENTQTALRLYNQILCNLPAVQRESQSLSRFLFGRYLQGDATIDQFIWVLSNSQLTELLQSDIKSDELFMDAVTSGISRQGFAMTYDQFQRVYSSKLPQRNETLQKLITSNMIAGFTEGQLDALVADVTSNQDDYFLIKNLAEKSPSIVMKLLNLGKIADDYLNCLIGYSLTQQKLTIPDEFICKISSVVTSRIEAGDLGQLTWNQALSILSLTSSIPVEVSDRVLSQIDLKQSFIPEFIEFIAKCSSNAELTSWMHKSMLYITRKFAESSHLSAEFDGFLSAVGDYILNHNVWSVVPSNVLNTQIEVILNSKWSKGQEYLKYTVKLVTTAPKQKIDFEKLFQIALNLTNLRGFPTRDTIQMRYYSSVILYVLFNFDHLKLSNPKNLELLLENYLGSNRAEDLFIKSMLIKIESKISMSWLTKVVNWEFLEELVASDVDLVGQERLISNSNGNLTVCLNKGFIKNSLTETPLELPELTRGAKMFAQLEDFYKVSSLSPVDSLSYDFEFLLMIILNNEELLKYSKDEDGVPSYTFNIKNLIETGILQFVIITLSSLNTRIQSIAQVIISKVLASIDQDSSFKDKNVYRVYLSSTLFTLTKNQTIPHLVWYTWSQLVAVLSNPGHFLYEKAFRYVLSTPSLKHYEIPLYNLITNPKDNDNEWYYRELNWLIENTTDGIITQADISVLKNALILEGFLNLINSKYANIKLKTSILRLLYKITRIDQGSDLLITRFGALCDLELIIDQLDGGSVVDSQMEVNIDEILVNFAVGVRSSKRVRNWTNDELDNNLKRIHKSIQVE
ncbi:Nucleolar pre-ribosomal-associated protein 1 [Candida viswanathii]|uniref:Nucleolar pre-ribosomal-associated protein 1 n=1 Tax=Candida viswanathii TaxID=5486 RepID=A0A367YDP1_9ASCO|nr:Nucleolar pre-ribosomal-associated protein 1 [Candida viswanathii]